MRSFVGHSKLHEIGLRKCRDVLPIWTSKTSPQKQLTEHLERVGETLQLTLEHFYATTKNLKLSQQQRKLELEKEMMETHMHNMERFNTLMADFKVEHEELLLGTVNASKVFMNHGQEYLNGLEKEGVIILKRPTRTDDELD